MRPHARTALISRSNSPPSIWLPRGDQMGPMRGNGTADASWNEACQPSALATTSKFEMPGGSDEPDFYALPGKIG
jgi:hypothetical protein